MFDRAIGREGSMKRTTTRSSSRLRCRDGSWSSEAPSPISITDYALATDVLAFASHPGASYYHWAWVREGIARRVFAYFSERDETLVGEGDVSLDGAFADREKGARPDEHTVMNIAAAWSIDPTKFEDATLLVDDGWLAKF
jgi:hypothetical protein